MNSNGCTSHNKCLRANKRFKSYIQVDPETGCWLWTKGKSRDGYGEFNAGRRWKAHRFAFHMAGNELIPGLTLDHLCRVRHCVNPDHLEQVDLRTNILRGENPSAKAARVICCPKGHPYDEQNTNTYQGYRRCKACRRELDKRRLQDPVFRKQVSIRQAKWYQAKKTRAS